MLKYEPGDPRNSAGSQDTAQDDDFKSIDRKIRDDPAEPCLDPKQRGYRNSSRRGKRLNYRALFGDDYSPSEEESESNSEAEADENYEKLSPASKRKAQR
eukprot:jgi/Picsp_1/6060/NSC_03414-R1_---NA---